MRVVVGFAYLMFVYAFLGLLASPFIVALIYLSRAAHG